jgi:hypothetical protein
MTLLADVLDPAELALAVEKVWCERSATPRGPS